MQACRKSCTQASPSLRRRAAASMRQPLARPWRRCARPAALPIRPQMPDSPGSGRPAGHAPAGRPPASWAPLEAGQLCAVHLPRMQCLHKPASCCMQDIMAWPHLSRLPTCVAAQLAAPTGSSGRWRMGGLGFGLPLSRLYARYFGGALPPCCCSHAAQATCGRRLSDAPECKPWSGGVGAWCELRRPSPPFWMLPHVPACRCSVLRASGLQLWAAVRALGCHLHQVLTQHA